MKVAISQGHAKGIGLEVFFKSCLMLGRQTDQLILFASKTAVRETLEGLAFPFVISESALRLGGLDLRVHWVETDHSFEALNQAISYCEATGSILFTLPTSKDQFPSSPGHTEFFRTHYKNPDLGMFFSSPELKVLLVTDHVAVQKLPKVLTEELIYRRILQAVTTLNSWQWRFDRILVSGFNPHSGEGGLIGDEDPRVKRAIERLRVEEDLDVSGPYPGDTILFEKRSPHDLVVYMFHDQGLGVFKGRQGLIGSNITLGLPYPRFSPDHGTSFGLFGKNLADYRGCAFALREALALRENLVHGKNSGHQGQGPQPKKHRR